MARAREEQQIRGERSSSRPSAFTLRGRGVEEKIGEEGGEEGAIGVWGDRPSALRGRGELRAVL